MLINVSNHPHSKWPERQLKEARAQYGNVVDLPFPQIKMNATSEDIDRQAELFAATILAKDDHATVMIQGEYVFTFRLVSILKCFGIVCVAAGSARQVEEYVDEQGNHVKKSVFRFEQFLCY
ncbi:MAG: hypothetical protein K6E71_05100 [Lachnospiraceae bacterium]|nr:hypothetical protein [Lachnospiraceae bacterium]